MTYEVIKLAQMDDTTFWQEIGVKSLGKNEKLN